MTKAELLLPHYTKRTWRLLLPLALLTGCQEPADNAAKYQIGDLDCLTDDSWSQQGQHDPALPGKPGTPADVLQAFLARYRETYELEPFQIVGDSTGALTIDGREVVLAVAIPVESGGLFVSSVRSCGPYRPLD